MTLHVLDIPDDPAELAGWLEQHLIGLDLNSVICQLRAFQKEEPAPTDLRETLAEWYEQVLAGGLKLLPVSVLQRLFAHPSLLLELQEEVCVNGGRYWDRLESPSEEIKQLVASSKAQLEERIRAESVPGPRPMKKNVQGQGEEPQTLQFEQPRTTKSKWVGAVFALAASVLVLLGTVAFLLMKEDGTTAQPTAVAWGWSKPGVLDRQGSASEYLNHLADAAEQWNNKRPEEPRAIIDRLHEFRKGCSDLILAPHEPLAAEDRAWLKERCQAWAKKIDEHIVRAEAGEAIEARSDADETVQKLVDALRTRAKSVQS
jgi:hypothetical protein